MAPTLRTIRRNAPRALGAALALGAAGAAVAQPADVDPFHLGYAVAFGSGAYRLSDGTETRVVRGSFSKQVRETPTPEQGGPGVRLLFPVTVGVQNLDDADLPPDRPTDRAEYAAFLPGVELEFPASERVTLRARAQLGWGTELQGAEQAARLGAAGVRSRMVFPGVAGRPAWISGLLWAGFDIEDGDRQSMLRFTQALEFEIEVPRWQFRDRPMRLLPHVLGDWYYRPPPLLAYGDSEFEQLEREAQIGVAAGREGGFKILFFEFDAVGVAFRASEHSEGIRFYLNSVF